MLKYLEIYKTDISGCYDLDYTFNTENIGNKIEFCTVKSQNFKTACITVSFTLPLSKKASLFALVPSVLTHSSKLYPSVTQIERKAASLYGADITADVTKSGENQVIKFGVSCIDDRFALDNESIVFECAKFLFEMIFNPNTKDGIFLNDDVLSEKRILTEQLGSEKSDKRIYAKTRCEEEMFADEIYGINRLGTEKDIEEATSESVFEAYKEILKKAYITVCVCADNNVNFENVKELFKEYFPKIERHPEIAKTYFKKCADSVKYKKETDCVKQGKLVMGFRSGMENEDDNYGARRVMTDLFGGSPHSKLFTVVREKMSLCYYCSARMYMKKGVMFVQSGIENYNEEKAKEAILLQLEDIKNGKFSEDDISASVKALSDGFKSVSDSPESLDTWFMSQNISEKYLYPEDYINMFRAVTKEDIIKAANDVTLDTVFMLSGEETDGECE